MTQPPQIRTIASFDDPFTLHRTALRTTLAALAMAVSLGLLAKAHADETIVVVDGAQDVWRNGQDAAARGDMYIIEQDDVTDELMIYVWRDSNGDGKRDSFDVVKRAADGWSELVGK